MSLQIQQSAAVSYPVAIFEEVFSNANGAIFQSDSEKCWYVDFAGKLARFDYRNLLKLQKAVYKVNIEEKLLSSDKSADVEIIFICACDHSYVLSLLELIKLKELLQGTFVMLELNHIIQDRLFRLVS
jgi:ABC-type protease/lipase transport system fused ATPase/permease subunit